MFEAFAEGKCVAHFTAVAWCLSHSEIIKFGALIAWGSQFSAVQDCDAFFIGERYLM